MAVKNEKMQKKTWGEKIWEDKILNQSDFEVAQGSIGTKKSMKKRTKEIMKNIDSLLIPEIKRGEALDAGVGAAAPFLIKFSKKGFHVTGVDISETTVKKAMEKARKENIIADFVKDDITSLGKIRGDYDLVYCIGTFGHIPSFLAVKTLNSFNRVLKKNGFCIVHIWLRKEKKIRDIFYDFAYGLLRSIKKIFRKTFDVNVSTYTLEEISGMVKMAGFEIVKFKEDFFLLRKIRN